MKSFLGSCASHTAVIDGDRAYFVYPVTFTDTQKGKTVVYKGTWAMTLLKTRRGWVITGSGSNWV